MQRTFPAHRLRRTILSCLFLGLPLLPALASAQTFFKQYGPYSSAQGALPSEGPAAARINPAALADVRLASVAYGHYGSVSGKSGIGFLQAALGTPREFLPLPVALAAGFGYMYQGSGVDGSNSVYEEKEYDPGLAVRLPADPESRWHLEAGLTFAIHEYNAFNAVESYALGVDAGAQYSIRTSPGLFGLGFAYHDLKSPRVRLPYDNGGYFRIPGWMEPSFAWTTFSRRLRAQMSFYIDEPWDKREGPAPERAFGINGWDLELKTWRWLALKGERTRLAGRSNLGLVLYLPPEWVYWDTRMEINFGHERLDPFAYPIPFLSTLVGGNDEGEGLGLLLGLSLSVGI